MAAGDPLRLSRMTVLLPTRRAVRALREAFLRLSGEGSEAGTPLLLPRLLPNAWPGILAAEGALNPADRRNRLLRRQTALWRKAPPSEPVIAAGLTGGFAALDELLGVVAGLPQGAVILPGLDRTNEPELW